MAIQGIYIIRNKINKKVYIGQSIDIYSRWITHYRIGSPDASPKNREYKNKIHTAMRELGRENFYIELLEECSKEELDDKEIYWIKYYNSYYDGYNGTMGGQFASYDSTGEKNGRSLLSYEDVVNIRKYYNDRVPFRDVYMLYQNKISKRGLQKVWNFETWKDVLPEFQTEENKKWHKTRAKANSPEVASNNKRAFSPEQVKEMRDMYSKGLTVQEIWQTFYPQYSKTTIYNIIHRKTYKDIY